jgi:methylated-DNA-[protein]-cysteine S-methyltransferase
MIYVHAFATPLSPMLVAVDDAGALVLLLFGGTELAPPKLSSLRPWTPDAQRCSHVVDQVMAYFHGERREFELALAARGTPFQQRVWEQLRRVPYGTTISYTDLAARVGSGAGACRAVGGANAANPIAVVVPCHRVIAANGSLSGYAGGVAIKQALLRLEQAAAVGPTDAQGSLFRGLQL